MVVLSKSGRKVGAAFIHFRPPDPSTRSHLQVHPPDATGIVAASPDHPYSSTSITGSHLLSLPWHMSVFDAELYSASCALQYAASLSPRPGLLA